MKPVFITPEGVLLEEDRLPKASPTEVVEEPLHVLAARQAEKQSTKKKVSE